MDSSNQLPKTYDPQTVETDIYQLWEQSGAFAPLQDSDQEPFCIVAPPPNANGALHIGHAVGVTLQDLMTRYQRLKGRPTLWLPGFDHAGFETQVVYEKKLEKEGRSRFQIPREQLYQEMYDFTQANKEVMIDQFRKLGASFDWSHQIFTLDPRVVSLVYQTFKRLADDGLVYRGTRPINWCTKHQTSLSDLEVKHLERIDPLYYIKYGPLTLATVRPETKFGDTAVAVHPEDSRYQQYVGQEIEIETVLGKATIKVIADEYVNPEFGTGVVKITPMHDPNDFEVAKRHPELPVPKAVIDQYGKLTEAAGPYAGLKIAEARTRIVEDMKAKGLIEKIDENYTHTVGVCFKCNSVIEPRVLPQWFMAMTKTGTSGKNLRDDAVAAVKAGKVQFVSEKFENTFFRWMENLYDWNISRQIVWGIQLPVWYCQCQDCQCQPIITDGSTPDRCLDCGSSQLVRDPDTFDTWFSSGQWPIAALRAQSETDFQRFYPTAVMETAYDILFFWVSRMIMLGLYITDQVPFRHVYIHGLVRDKDRQKMSKSKGNVINPLGVAEQYGSDAVRFALAFGNSPGNDIIVTEDKIKGMRNFANKLWNISRFVLIQTEGQSHKLANLQAIEATKPADTELITGLAKLTAEVSQHLDNFQFHLAAEQLYEFIWHSYADIYLEQAKKQIAEGDAKTATHTKELLMSSLLTQLTLLHPFMPFVTEAIYQSLPIEDKGRLLMTGKWPETPNN